MSDRIIQQARDTRADWASNNPTLAAGEFGYETDSGAIKLADGVTAWASLAHASAPSRTSMPTGSLENGMRVWRSDLDKEFFYDGTRWLTTQLYQWCCPYTDNVSSGTTRLNGVLPPHYRNVFSMWITTVELFMYNSSGGSWALVLEKSDATLAYTTVVAQTFTNTGFLSVTKTANLLLAASVEGFRLQMNENSGGAVTRAGCIMNYRLVGT